MDSKKCGLGEKERNLLQRHWKILKQNIRMGDIVDNLIVDGVLKPPQWDDLKRKYNIEKERTEEFLLMLQRKSNKNFVVFREALRENGYEHVADKLDFHDDKQSKKNRKSHDTSDEFRKELKELRDNDAQRKKEIVEMKQKQEQSSQDFEKKLALNLQQTNIVLDKLKESLRQKEEEIDKLKKIQLKHEESNKALTEENKKLENEREQMHGELKLKASEREEMDLRMKKNKLDEEKVTREKENLKKRIERQSQQLEQEKLEKNKAIENLKSERTVIDLMKREKTELEERIEQLEDENEVLSLRPLTDRTCRTSRALDDDTSADSLTLYHRQPTGLSDMGDNNSMVNLFDQRREIEAEIKKKQIEQKYLKNKLREMKGMEPAPNESRTCVIQ